MKKAAILFCFLLCLVLLVGCKATAEASVAQTSGDSTVKPLSSQDAATLSELVSGKKWSEGTPDCLCDCVLVVEGETLYYHSDCGSLSNYGKEQSLTLTDDEQVRLNQILEKYVLLGENAAF